MVWGWSKVSQEYGFSPVWVIRDCPENEEYLNNSWLELFGIYKDIIGSNLVFFGLCIFVPVKLATPKCGRVGVMAQLVETWICESDNPGSIPITR